MNGKPRIFLLLRFLLGDRSPRYRGALRFLPPITYQEYHTHFSYANNNKLIDVLLMAVSTGMKKSQLLTTVTFPFRIVLIWLEYQITFYLRNISQEGAVSGFGWWRYSRWAAALAIVPVLALAGVNHAMAEPSFDEAQAAYERRDFDLAYRLLSDLAADSHPDAQNLLGVMYENSDGVALDFAKAASWYEKAARQGDAEAQFKYGEGVPRSEERAAYWYSKAAENGLLLAQYTLGLMYRQGRGVPKDDKLAAYWLPQVADRGFAVAQLNLGIMYLRGEGSNAIQKGRANS